MKEWAKTFYSSTAWKLCRDAYAESVSHLCEECLKKGIVKAGEIVHHKTWITEQNINDPSITLNFENLKYVCRECHAAEHRATSNLRYYFDSEGNCIIKEPTK